MASSETVHNNEEQEQSRKGLELRLKELVESLLEIGITAYDFQAESGDLLNQRIGDLVNSYSQLNELKDSIDIQVPFDVLSFIEDGKNPDLFTREYVERLAAESHFTNGKIEAMKDFRGILENELNQTFPEQMDAYRKQRSKTP
ncbi:RNA polymerase II mediator complex subunit [Basidiobolus ranarum]|uniref:Mediator of RNA polymerase II transcription subunit 10 n=1 Tax=Basidiobolus ranarum TaxID=34480 RepID=A0ABR2WI12_9FUNG